MTARMANQSFSSTFTSSFGGWVQESGSFSTANNYLVNTSYGGQCIMRRDTANADFQMKFSYRDASAIPGPWGQVRFRYGDSSNFGYFTMYPASFSLCERRAGTGVTLASGAWSTTSGDWYDVTIIAEGSHIEVWRGPKGGAQTRMCSVDNAAILSGQKSYLFTYVDAIYAFDDIQMTAEDLSTTSYTYDAANQLTAMDVDGTTTNFTYDDWGRMAGKTQGAYAAAYTYRFGDKLKAATSSFPGETASVGYNYDGLGRRRLEQRDNTTATWFRWSGWEECGEYAGTVGSWTIGSLQTGYVPGLAAFAGSNPSTAEWRYHLTDHLGSVRQLTGQTKAALARYDYAPYGELLRSAGLPLTVGYTGHLWDNAIGQYYAPFRYYNPQTARWNMRDPLGFVDGPNVYAYVAGSPVNYIDPDGRLLVIGGIVGGIAGGLSTYLCTGSLEESIIDGIGGAIGGFFPVAGLVLGPMASQLIRYGRDRFFSPRSFVTSFGAGLAGSRTGKYVGKIRVNRGSVPNYGWVNDIDNVAQYMPTNTRSPILRTLFRGSTASALGIAAGAGLTYAINRGTGQCNK